MEFAEFPTDMITEIVCRLPISTLYKCTKPPLLLCNKELHNIISDPNFPLLFQSYDSIKPCCFLAYDEEKVFLIDYDPKTNDFISTQLNMDFVNMGDKIVSTPPLILTSCNGWLLVKLLYYGSDEHDDSCFSSESVYLVNPITHRCVTIVPNGPFNSLQHHRYIFGYIRRTNQYKVVRFTDNYYEILTFGDDGLSTSTWRKITNNPLYNQFEKEILDYYHNLVVVKGFIYCLVNEQRDILKFDLENEEFELVYTPYSTYNPGYCGGSLGVMGESLYMGAFTWSEEGLVIWSILEDGWIKQTTIEDFYIPDPFEMIQLLDDDKILIMSHKDKKLHCYDFKAKKSEENFLRIQGLDENRMQLMTVLKVVPSFLSLKYSARLK